MNKKAKEHDGVMEIAPIQMREVTVNVIGSTPLIMHRFSAKARQELLLPARKKNAAEKALSLKHDPVSEFREALYRSSGENPLSFVHVPTGMISRALADVAVDIPGAAKAAIGRQTSIVTPTLYLYGIPELHMSMVRSSDMQRTPDVRTRPIFPKWAIPGITIRYMAGSLTDRTIMNLLSAAGQLVGIGDWRPQRRGGTYGQFRLCGPDDAELADLIDNAGYSQQQLAYETPKAHDDETAELLEWFEEEIAIREKTLPSKIRKAA